MVSIYPERNTVGRKFGLERYLNEKETEFHD
jgi:hypothetical protein